MRPRLDLAYRRLKPVIPVAVIAGLLGLVPYTTCLVKIVFHAPCPGCGMTRATLRLLHGDVMGSLRFHPVALPGAIVLAVACVLALALPEAHPAWDRFVRITLTAFGVALLIAWALRFFGVLPWV